MSQQKKRGPCPSCRANNGDSSGNHLLIYPDGKAGYCIKEQKTIRLEGAHVVDRPTTRNKDYNSIDLAVVHTLPIMAYEERGISKQTMEHFGVRTAVNQEDGSPAEHYYPYTDEFGKVCGYKQRVLPKKRFQAVEGSKIKTFFGKNKVQGNRYIIVVEGEQDALAAHEIMRQLFAGKTREDGSPREPWNVISLPHGANEEGTLDATVRKELEWLGAFEKVVLCLDMDAPGRATANTLADYLVSTVKEVRIAELPLKDTADMLEAGREREWAKAINQAKPYVSEQIVLGTDTSLDDLLKAMPQGIMFPFLPKTCAKLDGFRTKEMTTLIAPPNVGKSSLFRQMMHYILTSTDDPVGAFFLEEGKEKTKQSILAYHAGIPLNKFRRMSFNEKKNNPLVVEAYEKLLPRLHLFEHKRKVLTDELIERKIEYMVKALGCKWIPFDHLSYVIGGRDSANERKDIDMLMTRLSRSVEEWDYHLFLVSHIKRGGKEQSRTDKDKKYPYWETLDLSDGRGSGAIEQLSHNMIALEKQVVDPSQENTRGLVRTRILRAREWGNVGLCDYLTWDEHGQFRPVEDMEDM